MATCNSWLPWKLLNGHISFPNEMQHQNVLIWPVEDFRSVIIRGEIGLGGCSFLSLLIYWIKFLLWGLTRSSGMIHFTMMCCTMCYNEAEVLVKSGFMYPTWSQRSSRRKGNFWLLILQGVLWTIHPHCHVGVVGRSHQPQAFTQWWMSK